MSAVLIKKALETRLAAQSPQLATQWENTPYTPVAGTPYQKVHLLLASPENLENTDSYQENGFMQVDLRYPANGGAATALARAQLLREWFLKNLTLSADGVNVTINRTAAFLSAYNEGDRYIVPVRIFFFSNIG